MVGLLAAGDGVKVREAFTLRAGYMSWLPGWYAEGMDCTWYIFHINNLRYANDTTL